MSGKERMRAPAACSQIATMTPISTVSAKRRVYRFRKVSADPGAPLGGCRWRGNLPIPKHSHWSVRRLVQRLNEHQTTMTEACKRAGLARTSIWNWANEYHPRIDEVEAALNAVGLRFKVVEMDESE